MLLASITAATTRAGNRYAFHWAMFSFLFLLMSLTEAMPLYNFVVKPIERKFDFGGIIHATWLMPVIILTLAYARFLAALPVKTRLLFIVSGFYFGRARWVWK